MGELSKSRFFSSFVDTDSTNFVGTVSNRAKLKLIMRRQGNG
jgi:hypothetical protein